MRQAQSVVIREAHDQDRDAARAVTLAAYEQYATFMPSSAWEIYRADIIETLEGVSPAEHIIAEQDGEIVGSVLLLQPEQPDDEPEVRLLAVAPAARGRRIGVALMEECIRRSRQAGYSFLTLHTHEIMAIAMGMYERMGFVRAPELDFSPMESSVIKGYRLRL